MNIAELKILKGPNYWSVSKHKLVQMLIDLEAHKTTLTTDIPGFFDRLKRLMPTLYNHSCVAGEPGGIFKMVQEGTSLAHLVEHIAIELQELAGLCTRFGRTRSAGKEGLYHVVFSYCEEDEAVYTANAAVKVTEALVNGVDISLKEDIEEIKRLYHRYKLGPTTQSIVDEAVKRDIPFIRLNYSSYVQLGYGARQKRVEAALTNDTGYTAVETAGDKDLTKKVLKEAYVPVPSGVIINRVDQLKEAIKEVGFPLVVKPLDGNQGKGATININSWPDVTTAFLRAQEYSNHVIVERYISGHDFRVLVVDYKFVAAALRTPAAVTGNGRDSIGELIAMVNRDPRRGMGHEKVLTAIQVDDVTREILAKKNYTLDTVLPKDHVLYLKTTANLSTGGTATDVTDNVHPENIKLFERIARIIGLDICGIDIIAWDLASPIKKTGGAVIEVNAAPGLRMHLQPSFGQPRNVSKSIVDMLFPEGNGRIPITAITGTNGKTTTTRLLARMVQDAGYTTGYTTTDGIYIDGTLINEGDSSGPHSARLLLKDTSVEFAVLECARGGLLRAGLAFDKCDCAIVTNVAADHLGMGGIDTVEQLAKVKSVVPQTVMENGYAILNADDDLVYAMKDELQCKIALFSLYPESARIEQHCEQGGLAAFIEDGYVMLRRERNLIPVEELNNIPITFGGIAQFNSYNVLAATLAAYTNRIPLSAIAQTLRSFTASSETTPGRMNLFRFEHFTVLSDYAHNPHALRALGQAVQALPATVRTGVIAGVGDRRDEDIMEFAGEAARIFDRIIIRQDKDLRGRSVDELNRLLLQGIHAINPDIAVSFIPDETEAVDHAIHHAIDGSLIVLLTDKVAEVSHLLEYYLKVDKEKALA
ncbi:cyanophycin synthetase [Cnuella takakiae]|uniref:Cyanophycin synthetase n=1 Tax=Cnuella takakiae TaxID=1302690 RepID=A0A1M4SZ88_9BACT|nr:cyanophycin synthetase [Cnuella takakiae]OLY90639.1 cyanophycin synthetase [Cnuella takakiae]SHE37536.1 cyanophycin synthetase [Cnuella takakiae]